MALREQRGARVVQAADGRLALRAVREQAAHGRAIDLVLMDLQMPVMGGWRRRGGCVRSTTGSSCRSSACPLLHLPPSGPKRWPAGMNDFDVKPIDPRKLERAILRAVAGRMEVLR